MKFLLTVYINMIIFLTIVMSIPLVISEFTNSPIHMDEAFREDFESFLKDAKKYKVSLNLRKHITTFSSTVDVGTAAYCVPSTNTVVVSVSSWRTLNRRGRKALLYHEWAHCILRRDHADNMQYFPRFCPVSLMYPYIEPLERCYTKESEDEYNKELFTNPHNYKKFSRRKK